MNACACGCGCLVRGTWHQGHNRRSVPPTNKIGFTVEHGYVWIYKPDHPRSRKNGYVKRSTIVAEDSAGRFLNDGECVHHINGIKTDDRDENLQILQKKEHDRISVMVSDKCLHPGCDRKHKARGLCGIHYSRYAREGIEFPLAATRRNRWNKKEG